MMLEQRSGPKSPGEEHVQNKAGGRDGEGAGRNERSQRPALQSFITLPREYFRVFKVILQRPVTGREALVITR